MFFSSESHFMQQSCIIHQMETRDCIVVISLLVHFCQSRLIGPNKPIIATCGEDITLPCHLVPGENVAEMTFEWTRPDLEPRFVFVWRTRQDLVAMKNPSYKDRSSLFTDELKHGNISLKLSKVKPADEGRYRCYIPAKDEEAFIDLVVASGAVSSPVISLEGIDRDKTGVMLECKSEGWHPKPELLWLDGEGNLLSAGPTETLRGPDDLYTVSSRVTVEKRHSNNITCRVQQRNTNQIRETQKHVSDELFQLTSSSTAPVIIGVVVSLAVIILILIGVFFLWRRNKKKKKNPFKGDQTETDQEQQTLMTQDIKPVSDMTESNKTTKHEEKPETNKKLKEDEKQDFQQEKQTDVKVVNPKSPQEHESPRRTNTGTIETLTQMRAKESPGWRHPAGTEQKPQESVAMSSQAQPAAGCTRADRPLSPDTQDPRAPHTPADAHRSQWAQAQPVSHQAHEEKQETDKKVKEDEKQDFQQVEKKPSINEVRKKFEINQHAAEEKLKEEHHHHLQKKHAEISNMKKEEENQEADKKFKKDDKKQDFKQEVKKTVVNRVVNPQNTREPETPKRTNKRTFVAMNQTRAKERPGWKHPAGTEQKPQESAAMSSQAQPAANCTRADRPLSPDTQDPRAPHTPTGIQQSQGVQARPSSRQEEKQEADKKVKEDKKQDFQQEKKQPSIKNVWKQFEEKQEAEKKMKEANEKQKEKKHAEISNMKKEPETSKLKTQRSFQEQNKSSSANNSSARGDIILDKVDTHGQYICLKNTSSENKLMGDWEVKLQVNETQPVTFKVETNFTLKAGERLTLHRVGAMSPYPDDAEMGWMGMTDWEFGDDLKISLISNTGEEHRLK